MLLTDRLPTICVRRIAGGGIQDLSQIVTTQQTGAAVKVSAYVLLVWWMSTRLADLTL